MRPETPQERAQRLAPAAIAWIAVGLAIFVSFAAAGLWGLFWALAKYGGPS